MFFTKRVAVVLNYLYFYNMKRTYFIYKLTAPNGKVYIGQAININRRFSSYRNLNCKNQPKLFNSIKKYGWDNFKKEILFDGVISQSEINELETKYISKYFKNGLNLCDIGSGGNSKKGSEHFASKPVLQINKKFEIVSEFECGMDASKHNNIPQSCVSISCRTNNPFSHGYYWRFKDGYSKINLIDIVNSPHPNSEKIIQLSKNGEFIKNWDSQTKASKELNINQANLWRVLNGEGMTCGGFKWIRESDYINKKQSEFKYKIRGIAIIVKNLKGEKIGSYNSIKDASLALKVDRSSIIRQLKNKINNPKKYIYEYRN